MFASLSGTGRTASVLLAHPMAWELVLHEKHPIIDHGLTVILVN